MAKVTAQEIVDMGFTHEMFGKASSSELTAMITVIITEQAALLEGRVGSTPYADSQNPNATYVKRAEKCLVAAEVVQARIIYITGLAVPNGEEPDTRSLDRQVQKYLDGAEGLIAKIVAGVDADASGFATGATISSGLTRADFQTNFG